MYTKVPTVGTGTIDTCMSGHCYLLYIKPKTKDLEGIPLLGGQFGYYPPMGA